MAAPSGTLYPGNFDSTTNIGSAVSSGQTIASAYADTQSSAILAIEQVLNVNPQGSDPSVGDAIQARARQTEVQNQALTYGADSGTANAYAVTLTPAWASYIEGQIVSFKPANTNTSASTLDVNGLGAQTMLKNGTLPMAAGDLPAGQVVSAVYDGTNFQTVIQPPGVKVNVNPQSTTYTATSADMAIPVTTGASSVTLTLPDSTSNLGQLLYIQKADAGAGAVVVTAAGTDVINGSSTVSLASQYNAATLVSDGAGNWLVMASV